MKKEAATVPHVSGNGRVIPDWAQIVSLLANSGFAPAIQQVPATMISYGTFKNVPYISFRCGYGDYEINVFGDLNQPAAVQIGAMNYLHQTAAEKTNCVNFICSVLANAADRKMVRALDWNLKDVKSNGSMTFETLPPRIQGILPPLRPMFIRAPTRGRREPTAVTGDRFWQACDQLISKKVMS